MQQHILLQTHPRQYFPTAGVYVRYNSGSFPTLYSSDIDVQYTPLRPQDIHEKSSGKLIGWYHSFECLTIWKRWPHPALQAASKDLVSAWGNPSDISDFSESFSDFKKPKHMQETAHHGMWFPYACDIWSLTRCVEKWPEICLFKENLVEYFGFGYRFMFIRIYSAPSYWIYF
jgi:hypothetical protein